MTDQHPEPVHPHQRQFASRKAPLGRGRRQRATLAPHSDFEAPTTPQGTNSGATRRPYRQQSRPAPANAVDAERVAEIERMPETDSLLPQEAGCGLIFGPRESAPKALLFRANRAMNDRPPEAVVTGLPAEVIDGLVEDLADAVVAMLLNPETAETVECDDESGDLRPV